MRARAKRCAARADSSIIAHSTIIAEEIIPPVTVAHHHLLSLYGPLPLYRPLSLHHPYISVSFLSRIHHCSSIVDRRRLFVNPTRRSSIGDRQSSLQSFLVGNGRLKLEPPHWRRGREICDLHHGAAGAIARKRPRPPRIRTTAGGVSSKVRAAPEGNGEPPEKRLTRAHDNH